MKRVKCIILISILTLTLTACNTSCSVSTTEVSSDAGNSEIVTSKEELASSEDNSERDSEIAEQTSDKEDIKENVSDAGSGKEETSGGESNPEGNATSEEESVSEEEPEITVEEHNAVLFVKKAVNVRKGPSTDYEKIGGLNKGDQIQVTGIADTGWYQIQYNGETAYVASSYLMDEASYQAMIAEEEAAALAAQQAAQQQASEQAAQQQQQQQQTQQQEQQQQPQQPQVNTGDYRAQVVALMNQERANAGVGGISQNASLDAVAQIRAQEIVQSFAHTRPNGTSCFTVLDEGGIAYMTAGENIAAGYGTPSEVMTGWMNSEGHRANILNGSFGQVGIGYYTDPNTPYGTYWVQIFTN